MRGLPGSLLAGLHQVHRAMERVPFHTAHFRLDHQVGMLPPGDFSATVQDPEASINHMEHVRGGGGGALHGQVQRDRVRGVIHQQAAATAPGLEQAGIGAACADGQHHIAAVAEDHGLAGDHAGGHHAERDAHLFEAVALEQFAQEPIHTVAAGDTHASDGPARHIGAEHADVRQAAREPSAQRQSEAHESGNRGRELVRWRTRPAAKGGLPTAPADLPGPLLFFTPDGLLLSWMRAHPAKSLALLLCLFLLAPAFAQAPFSGTPTIEQSLKKLTVLGSVLMIAAHPDDENTAILAYYARGRHMRTGYLSLTRGEGGQNLIGPEQGDLLGLIRSHELLAARRIDGAEQFFTRAIDFGFSKTPEETLAKWGR